MTSLGLMNIPQIDLSIDRWFAYDDHRKRSEPS